MNVYELVVHFIGGVALANSVPHLVTGVTGRPFPTPFGSPAFRGPSSPAVNVLWAVFNLALAYVLLFVVGKLDVSYVPQVAAAGAGFGVASFGLARAASRAQVG